MFGFMRGKGGTNPNYTYSYKSADKSTDKSTDKLGAHNYIYTYNLKYIKICARYPIKKATQLNCQPMCSTKASLTSTGPHYKSDLWDHFEVSTFKCTSCGTGECKGGPYGRVL